MCNGIMDNRLSHCALRTSGQIGLLLVRGADKKSEFNPMAVHTLEDIRRLQSELKERFDRLHLVMEGQNLTEPRMEHIGETERK